MSVLLNILLTNALDLFERHIFFRVLSQAAAQPLARPDPSQVMGLNENQRAAVEHGMDAHASCAPLLIVAGAGTGKTNTLAHRVAHLVLHGADPRRILLLTFTRRAAAEMTRRAVGLLAEARQAPQNRGTSASTNEINWSGTF